MTYDDLAPGCVIYLNIGDVLRPCRCKVASHPLPVASNPDYCDLTVIPQEGQRDIRFVPRTVRCLRAAAPWTRNPDTTRYLRNRSRKTA